MVQYLVYAPKFYMLVLVLSTGFPSIIRFVISIFPIFIGFSIAGTMWFGHFAKYFEGIDETAVTLFSLYVQPVS